MTVPELCRTKQPYNARNQRPALSPIRCIALLGRVLASDELTWIPAFHRDSQILLLNLGEEGLGELQEVGFT